MLKVQLVPLPDFIWKFLDDIIVDTIEGFSSFFWEWDHAPARNEKTVWYLPETAVGRGFSSHTFVFKLMDRETSEQHTLAPTDLVRGFELWAEWLVSQDEPILYPGCSEWDCVCADQVVQFAVFGELIYG
jgi:hypothetical protein